MNTSLPPSPAKPAVVSTPRHRLHPLFRPDSIAIFGVSEEPGSTGWRIYENLLQSNFRGKFHAINPELGSIFGNPCHPDLAALPKVPDLAVLAVPPDQIEARLNDLAQAGTRTAIWLADLHAETTREEARRLGALARSLGITMLGADSLGLFHGAIQMNLLASSVQPKTGGVAVLSQSSAVLGALLDYAQGNGVGLSTAADTGSENGIDLADLLDYLAFDGNTRSIAMFVDGTHEPRRFLSALRAAARLKPVVVLKGGYSADHARPAHSGATRLTHAERLYSRDATLQAALERSGAVIVDSFGELFATLEWLADNRGVQGNRLAIVGNGGGLAMLAENACHCRGVTVATPGDATLIKLGLKQAPAADTAETPGTSADEAASEATVAETSTGEAATDAAAAETPAPLGPGRSKPATSPVIDLGITATPERMADTLRQVVADSQVDAVLCVFQPTLACDSIGLANAILAGKAPTPLLLAMVGDADTRRGAELLTKDFSVFRTPEIAVRAFNVLAQYQRSQQRLLETPGPSRDAERFNEALIAELLEKARQGGRSMLNQLASHQILAACGIPTPRSLIASTIEEAVASAHEIGFPVVLKVQSQDVVHKSDVGGVRLDIRNEDELRSAARSIQSRLEAMTPAPTLDGFLVQPMIPRRDAREVLVGASRDPAFGPVIHFGAGGVTVEMMDDTAVALPPLSPALAEELIQKTRISKLLRSHHGEAAADMDGLVDVLLAVSALLTRFPQVLALDINPVLAGPDGVMALDARIKLDLDATPRDNRYRHLAIHPYPIEAEQPFMARPARKPEAQGPATGHAPAPAPSEAQDEEEAPPTAMLMRPIRPDDAVRLKDFFDQLTPESRLWRFLHPIRVMSPQMVARFSQVDYDRDMALVAVEADKGYDAPLIGVARYFREPNESRCEFSIVVLDSWQSRGVARILMEHLIETARANGLDTMIGLVHGNNMKMLNFMRRLGFQIGKDPDEPELRLCTLYIEPLAAAEG